MTETDNTRREHRSIYLNDINAVLPEGKRNYFSFVTYEDYSDLMTIKLGDSIFE